MQLLCVHVFFLSNSHIQCLGPTCVKGVSKHVKGERGGMGRFFVEVIE